MEDRLQNAGRARFDEFRPGPDADDRSAMGHGLDDVASPGVVFAGRLDESVAAGEDSFGFGDMAEKQEHVADALRRRVIGQRPATSRDSAEDARQRAGLLHVAGDGEQEVAATAESGQRPRALAQAIPPTGPGGVDDAGDPQPTTRRGARGARE